MISSLRPGPKVSTTIIRRGRRIYGHIYHFANRKVYLAELEARPDLPVRREMQFGCATQGDRILGVGRGDPHRAAPHEDRLGRCPREAEQRHLHHPDEKFFDRKKTELVNFERSRGAPQRYSPIKHFHHIPGVTKIKQALSGNLLRAELCYACYPQKEKTMNISNDTEKHQVQKDTKVDKLP